jgi:Leucine rich repeat variant
VEAYLPRFLAEPATILEAEIDLQLAIANYIDTPHQLLAVLVNSPDLDVASAARLHVTWAGEIEGDVEREIDYLLKTQQIGQNDRLAVELLKLGTVPPYFVSQWVPPDRIVESLDNPQMPVEYKIEFLERLAREDRLDIVVPVAGSSDTPRQLLARLIGSVHLAIRDIARNNPSCPPEAIESIDREYEIAANWDTPPAQLAISATSRWEWIRLTVAQNPFTSAETLLVLAQAEAARIRLAVANNPHSPAAVLQVLAENNDGGIRSLVAKHPHASEETLHYLFTDCQSVLRSRTDLPLSILERFFDERDRQKGFWEHSSIRDFLRQKPNTSAELLAQLATDCLDEIRMDMVARNPRNSETLETWVLEATDYLGWIVQHPNIGVETLTNLANHYNPKVRLAVGLNQKTPEPIRFNLLEQLGCHPVQIMDVRESFICDMDIKKVIARDLNTPVSILTIMAENELINNKVKIKTGRTLDGDWIETSNDTIVSRLKNEILNPAEITIESARWVEIIPDNDFDFQQLEAQWQELLPQLSSNSVKAVIGNIIAISNSIRKFLPRDPFWNTVVSLLGNPRTPEILREQLWQQYQRHPDITRYPERDLPLRFALATNPSTPEARRREYLRQLFDRGLTESIGKAPNIPQDLLLEFADINAGNRQAIARNPNAPYSLLLELSKDSNSTTRNWVAENPNTPLDILLTLTNDGALKNPNFPPLEVYRVTLANNLSNERQGASALIASLPLKTKLSLTQVVEGNELPAKLSIARDLQTPIEILERLAQDPNEDVRSTVASNRNLPLATLLRLADDPSSKVRSQLIHQQFNRSTPIEILAKLAEDPDSNIKMNIARNANTPPEILTQLAFADDPGGWISSSLVNNQNTSVETLEYLGVERHVVNAHNKKTPPNALAAQVDYALTMYDAEKNRIFEFLLRDLEGSQMPASSLVKLATNYESWIRARVASHRNTPAATLEQLSNDKSYEPILWGIARNPNSPPALLEKLLREDYQTVANYMVERAIIPPNIMGRLFESESEHLRSRIVYRNNLPLDLADRVINTETHDSVLISLARNPILTSELISTFIQRHELKPDVCTALLFQPNLTIDHWQQLANNQSEAVRLAIASRENTPIDILVILADDRELQVRRAIASNLQTPSDLLIKLAADLEAEVRTRIAANPQTPVPTLETLATDASVEVRRSVLNNPQTPASIRQDLEDIFGRNPVATTIDTLSGLPRIYDPANDDVITILTEYARSDNAFVRLVSLLHPLMPSEVIEGASRSAYWSDRYAVAKNSATPDLVRQSLRLDSNRIVRAIAQIVT